MSIGGTQSGMQQYRTPQSMWERVTDKPLLVAAMLTIPATIIEFSHASDTWRHGASILNWVIWSAFCVDVVVSLVLVSERHRYLRTHVLELVVVLLTFPSLGATLQYLRVLRLLRVLRAARLMRLARLARVASALYWVHRQAVGTKRFDLAARAAEPIRVTRVTVSLAAVGLLAWAAGQLAMWADLHGSRAAWICEVVGPVLVAIAVINHLRFLSRRFGHLAIVSLMLSVLGWGFVAAPFALDPSRYGVRAWAEYMSWTYGSSTALAALGLLFILDRKLSRTSLVVTDPSLEIHASTFQLAAGAIGLAIWSSGQFALLQYPAGARWIHILSTVGPLLVALAVIAHVEQLSLRIGLAAVDLGCVACVLWGVSYLPLALNPNLVTDSRWEGACFWGIAGVGALLAGIASLLVLFRKNTWNRHLASV